jgi:hypothetical protein
MVLPTGFHPLGIPPRRSLIVAADPYPTVMIPGPIPRYPHEIRARVRRDTFGIDRRGGFADDGDLRGRRGGDDHWVRGYRLLIVSRTLVVGDMPFMQ